MNTLNLILSFILIALISVIFGYNVGKVAGKKEMTKGFESFAQSLNKLGKNMNNGKD